jgi:uncharacterized protein (DUF983 family)
METMSPINKIWSREAGAVEKRDLWSSLKRGFCGRCPRCGVGRLFRAFLKVDNSCSVGGLDFTPHRADDLPAYLVIAIVGHIVVPAALLIETDYSPPVGLQLAIYLPLTALMSLALLQPVKGAVVGLQWALRMHGFGDNAPGDIPPRLLACTRNGATAFLPISSASPGGSRMQYGIPQTDLARS